MGAGLWWRSTSLQPDQSRWTFVVHLIFPPYAYLLYRCEQTGANQDRMTATQLAH